MIYISFPASSPIDFRRGFILMCCMRASTLSFSASPLLRSPPNAFKSFRNFSLYDTGADDIYL